MNLSLPLPSRGTGSWLYHKYLPLNDFPTRYGKVKDIEDFCLKAQMVSYEQYRALQEGFNYKMWDWYSGMLIWKNQNPWTALRGGSMIIFWIIQGVILDTCMGQHLCIFSLT